MLANERGPAENRLFRRAEQASSVPPAKEEIMHTQIERQVEGLRKPVTLVQLIPLIHVPQVGTYIRMANGNSLRVTRTARCEEQIRDIRRISLADKRGTMLGGIRRCHKPVLG